MTILEVTHASGDVTLVFNDLIFNLPDQSGVGVLVMRLLGSSGSPRVTRIAKWMMVKDAPAVRKELHQLSETPRLVRLVPAHGDVIDHDAPGTLRIIAEGI